MAKFKRHHAVALFRGVDIPVGAAEVSQFQQLLVVDERGGTRCETRLVARTRRESRAGQCSGDVPPTSPDRGAENAESGPPPQNVVAQDAWLDCDCDAPAKINSRCALPGGVDPRGCRAGGRRRCGGCCGSSCRGPRGCGWWAGCWVVMRLWLYNLSSLRVSKLPERDPNESERIDSVYSFHR